MNTSFHFPFDQDNKYYEKLMKGYKNGIETTFEEYLRKQHGVKWYTMMLLILAVDILNLRLRPPTPGSC